MKLKLIVIATLIAFIWGCKDEKEGHSELNELKTYTSDTMGFSLTYPFDWEIKYQHDSTNSVGFYEPIQDTTDKFQENLQIWIEDLPMTISDTLYKQATLGQLKIVNPKLSVNSLNDLSTQNAKFGHYGFEFTSNDRTTYQVDAYLYLKGDRGYNFTFTAEKKNFETYRSTLNQIMESFKTKP